jgi:peptide/nickel transport system substrate-binding protein
LDEDALIAQILKSNLAEIGIDVQIQGLETLAFLDSAFSLESDMTIWNYGAVSPDVSDPLSWIMATEWLFSGYETDTLLDQFFAYAEAATPEEDQAIVAQIQDEAIDEAAAIAIMEGSFLHGVNPDLNGFWAAPWGLYYYDTISLNS